MGLSVLLETRDGDCLERVDDPGNLLHRLLPPLTDESFHLLRFIDRYGDTVFNGLQAVRVIDEVRRLAPDADTPDARHLLHEVERLAALCDAEPHLYLRFLGD